MVKDTNKTIVYSALEVANICGVVNQTAINWIRNGYLTAFSTPGGQYRVYLDDLIQFMQKRKMRIPNEVLSMNSGHDTNSFLIVDDDRGLNNVLTKYIAREIDSCTVYQAYDGFEAGAQLIDKKPSILLLDLDLPGVDGFNLCKRINSTDEFCKPTVFIITALQEDGLEERVKEIGAKEFFRKPLNLVEIATAIKKYL